MRRFLLRLLHSFTAPRSDRELNREIDSHLRLLQDEFERRGLSPDEAHFAARRAYGSIEQTKELHRDQRKFPPLDHLLRDLRYGIRSLFKNRAFAIVAAGTLALGIGANTAIFSVVDAVLLQPLPFADANRLFTVLHFGTAPVSNANYLDWRDQTRAFDALAAASYWSPNISGQDRPEHLYGLQVTQNLLPMLGVRPALGRLFLPGEDRPGNDREVILSDRLWRRRFHSDRKILGKSITLDGVGYTIVGVMPKDFNFPPFWAIRTELWVPDPIGGDPNNRGGNHLRVFAHLRRSVSQDEARSEIASITGRLERQYPGTNRNVLVVPLKEKVVGSVEAPLLLVLGAVCIVLLITCANVAHMLLARSADRSREVGVRSALGASRSRLLAQFLTESLLLAAVGAITGAILAFWLVKLLGTIAAGFVPRIESTGINWRIILFLVVVSVFVTLLFGLAPAVQATGIDILGKLRDGGRTETGSLRRQRLRSFLVASEFAFAFLLLIGAGLMIRTFLCLRAEDPGFNPRQVLSMVVSVAGTKHERKGARAVLYHELLERVRSTPGVAAAAGINHLPLAGDLWGWNFMIEGRPRPRPGEFPAGVYRLVTPGYFQTMRLRLLSGRDFTPSDNENAPGVVIINKRAAETYWPGSNPIGQRITFQTEPNEKPVWVTVIGVAADAKQEDWISKPAPETYLAALQNSAFLAESGHQTYITLVARGSGDPAILILSIKKVVWSFDPDLPISEAVTMDEVVAKATALQRFELFLFGAFGMLALVLAAVGVYGVITYSVAQRVREIGIRFSLGATQADVCYMLMRDGLGSAFWGALAGFAVALILSRSMSQLLYGVQARDPLTYVSALLVLGLAGLAATFVPAQKAAKIEPMSALRLD